MKERFDVVTLLKMNKEKAIKYRKIFIIIATSGVALIFALFSILAEISNTMWLQSIPWAISYVGISLVILIFFNIKLQKEFENEVMKYAVSKVKYECFYTTDLLDNNLVYDSNIIIYNKGNKIKQSFPIYGNIKDYKFNSSFFKVNRKINKTNNIILDGRLFYFNVNNLSDMIIKTSSSKIMSKTKGLNKEVYKDIDIYFNEFNPFKDKLDKLNEYMKYQDIVISIKDNVLYIYITNPKKHFDLFSDNTTGALIESEYLIELNAVNEIINILF